MNQELSQENAHLKRQTQSSKVEIIEKQNNDELEEE